MESHVHADQAPPTISRAQAQELTDQIKRGVEALWKLIEEAWQSRAWTALDYASWDEYCAREFDSGRLRLPREDREEVIFSMREIGMSTRAIAAATGISKSAVSRELPPVPNGTPEPQSKITGRDGKAYQLTRRRAAAPPPRPTERTTLRVVPAPRTEALPKPKPKPAEDHFAKSVREHEADRRVAEERMLREITQEQLRGRAGTVEGGVAMLLAALETEEPGDDSDERRALLRTVADVIAHRQKVWSREEQPAPPRRYFTKDARSTPSASTAAHLHWVAAGMPEQPTGTRKNR